MKNDSETCLYNTNTYIPYILKPFFFKFTNLEQIFLQ